MMLHRQCSQTPVSFLKKIVPNGDSGKPENETDIDNGTGSGNNNLICTLCHARITKTSARIAVHGQHNHVFFNPHGHLFELGCFSMAPGTLRVGQSTDEFTWFTGYAWQILVCGGCQQHMGWHYQSTNGDGFWGLLLPNLMEEPDD